MARLAKLVLLGIGLSVIFALFSLIPQDTTNKKHIEYAKPLVPEQSQAGATACLRPFSLWNVFLCVLSIGGSTIQTEVVEMTQFQVMNALLIDMMADVQQEIAVRSQIVSAVDEAKQENAQMPSKHMALGFGDRGMLVNFTINLNLILNSYGITVHAYTTATTDNESVRNHLQQYMVSIDKLNSQYIISPSNAVPSWDSAGITNETIFSYMFFDVAEKVSVIHFNLDDIGSGTDALEFAESYGILLVRGIEGSIGNRGNLPAPITAHELLTIAMNPQLCAKTLFYRSGGNIPLNPPPIIDMEAKAIICSGFNNNQG
jgi:hypothetical protein